MLCWTLSTIINPTWNRSWGLTNLQKRGRLVQPSGDHHIVLLLSCKTVVQQALSLSRSPYFQPKPPPSTPGLPLFHSASPRYDRSHLVLSQGQVGFFWNGELLFLNGPTTSPVSFCGEKYAVCLWTRVPFLHSDTLQILIFIRVPHNYPKLMACGSGNAGWWSSRLSCGAPLSVNSRWLCISRNCKSCRTSTTCPAAFVSQGNYCVANWDCWPGLDKELHSTMQRCLIFEGRKNREVTNGWLIAALYRNDPLEVFKKKTHSFQIVWGSFQTVSRFCTFFTAYICTRIRILTSDRVAIFHTPRPVKMQFCKKSAVIHMIWRMD